MRMMCVLSETHMPCVCTWYRATSDAQFRVNFSVVMTTSSSSNIAWPFERLLTGIAHSASEWPFARAEFRRCIAVLWSVHSSQAPHQAIDDVRHGVMTLSTDATVTGSTEELNEYGVNVNTFPFCTERASFTTYFLPIFIRPIGLCFVIPRIDCRREVCLREAVSYMASVDMSYKEDVHNDAEYDESTTMYCPASWLIWGRSHRGKSAVSRKISSRLL